jgi:NADPH:quinone reductase-like Zn-dependent oxidoreductase
VLFEVRAAGINPSESAIRAGAVHHLFPVTFPSGQGSDLAGVVAELGAGVSSFAVGDEVIGFFMRRSSHAEYVTVPTHQLTAKPPQVSWEVAGSLFVAGATARYAAMAVEDLHVPRDMIDTIADFAAVERFGVLSAGGAHAATAEVFADLADRVACGELEVPIAGVFALDDVRDAFREVEKRHTRGKLVLRP